LYNTTAKELYNLTLYSLGEQSLAEQITIDAFASAYNSLSDKADVMIFPLDGFNGRKVARYTMQRHNIIQP
jgi:hypothetical protein